MAHLNIMLQVLNFLCAQDQDMVQYRIEIDEWLEIKHLLAFLRHFAEVTMIMSSQKSPTLSGVIVYFNVIMDHLDKYRFGIRDCSTTPLPDIVMQAAEASYQKIHKYYNKTNLIHCIVTLLDPRCNVQYFQKEEFTQEIIDSIKERYVEFWSLHDYWLMNKLIQS